MLYPLSYEGGVLVPPGVVGFEGGGPGLIYRSSSW